MSIYFVYLVYVGQVEKNNFGSFGPSAVGQVSKKIALSSNATGSLSQYRSSEQEGSKMHT